jgi:small-conductance mechanosensitive channel/CRP-like cAMP-binding protein
LLADWSTFVVAGGALLVVTLGLMAAIPNRHVRGRLGFAALLVVAFLALEVAVVRQIGNLEVVGGIARLLFTLAVILVVVTLAVNPWRGDGASERVPAIVQDVVVIGLFAVTATLLMEEKLLTTSAVGAVVIGFALQDTLGNLFAGLAIQIEKPFSVGHWVRIGDFEGKVQQVTWRATKLLTKHGQYVVVPNSVMSKDPILNYSEPTIPTRIDVEVGASYDVPPNVVKQALQEAVDNAPLALKAPPPVVVLDTFDASSITYRVLFWIDDFARDRVARDQVRTNIWYTFRRHGIEIPFPIQVEYSRDEQTSRPPAQVSAMALALASVELFRPLTEQERHDLAERCPERLFAAGERVVRQAAEGDSMFVVVKGKVVVTLEPSGQEVAVTDAGGFFGEMSMLTGQPRTATVSAVKDTILMEISADRFRELAVAHPGLVEHVAGVVERRRAGLRQAQAAAEAAAASTPAGESLLRRIQQFLGL